MGARRFRLKLNGGVDFDTALCVLDTAFVFHGWQYLGLEEYGTDNEPWMAAVEHSPAKAYKNAVLTVTFNHKPMPTKKT